MWARSAWACGWGSRICTTMCGDSGSAQLTGIPLPGESRGKVRKPPLWTATSLASISMGQEVSVTTIQIAQAVSAIANGGLLVKPRLVLKRGAQTVPQEPAVRAIKPETAFTMRQMMEGVVMPGGTGYPEARLVGLFRGGQNRIGADLRFQDQALHAQLQRVVRGHGAADQPGHCGGGDAERNPRGRRVRRARGGAGLQRGGHGGAAPHGRAARSSGRARQDAGGGESGAGERRCHRRAGRRAEYSARPGRPREAGGRGQRRQRFRGTPCPISRA